MYELETIFNVDVAAVWRGTPIHVRSDKKSCMNVWIRDKFLTSMSQPWAAGVERYALSANSITATQMKSLVELEPCKYMCMCVYTYVYMYIYVYTYMYMDIAAYLVHVCMQVF
jgi:hypothetical protein